MSVALLMSCSTGNDEATIGPAPGADARLSEAVRGLCDARRQAATDPAAAKATYLRRSEVGVHAATQALRPSHSVLTSEMAGAIDRVEADLAAEPAGPTLGDNLGRLATTMRRGLAALGISVPACER